MTSPDIDRWIRKDLDSLIDKVTKKGLAFREFKERLKRKLPQRTAHAMNDGRINTLYNQYNIEKGTTQVHEIRIKKPTRKTPTKTISVKMYGGTKAYIRTQPRRFSKQEIRFIKARPKKSNKELVLEFNKTFSGSRTSSSITTKKYRL